MEALAHRFLVLTDGYGGYYLIPMAVVESCRVEVEEREQVQALIDDADVRGQVLVPDFSGGIITAPGTFRVPLKTGSVDLQSVERTGLIKA
jgi:hypothetical protein